MGITGRRTAEDRPGRLLKPGEVAEALRRTRARRELSSKAVTVYGLLGRASHDPSSISCGRASALVEGVTEVGRSKEPRHGRCAPYRRAAAVEWAASKGA